MNFNKIIKNTFYISILFIKILIFSSSSQAAIVGEIINVNNEYKIAFTDLSNDVLSIGDIVEIHKNNQLVTYLEVAESSSAISKLIPVSSGEYSSEGKFKQISIGCSVLKITNSNSSTDNQKAQNNDSNQELRNIKNVLQEENNAIKSELVMSKQKIVDLENKIKALEQNISQAANLKNSSQDKANKTKLNEYQRTLFLVKEKLEKMAQIIESNN